MAINRNSDDSLSINDILRQVGITPGTTIDFASLGTLLGAGNSNHVLPDSFVGKTLTLSAGSISVSPSGTLSFAIAGESKTLTVTSNGVFLITDIPSWLSVSPIAATGSASVTLYASPNSDLGTSTRTATLNFLGASNISRATKGLSQNGNPVTAEISGDTSISSSTTTRNIILTLSNQLSVTSVNLTNTTGFSINTTPTTSVGATTTTYTYTLTITAATSGDSKESTAEFFVGGDGYSTTLRSKTTQTGLSAYSDSNITITGFDVNSSGTITAPTVSPAGGTIVYSTAINGGGTTYTLANGFPLVSSNTTRWATYTITVPAGYSNTGSPLSKTISAVQELISTFTSANISVTGFGVDYLGAITAPTVSPTATSIIYSTTENGSSVSSFSTVSSNTTRWCRVSVTVPAGYFNSGFTVTKTDISTSQPFFATIDVTPETHTFTNTGSSRVYSVSSNTTWVVSNTPSWITIDDTTGGGSDTQFTATATSQENPAVRRTGTLRVETNTTTNGIVNDDISFDQPPLATWSLGTVPSLDGNEYETELLTPEFQFNIPYTFDYMNSSFDRSNFGFFVNAYGAGNSITSNRLTSGNKNFTITPNTDVNGGNDQIFYDIGQRVSIAETTLRTIVRYMIGTVTAWNQSTRVLSVNIATTSGHIVTNNTTTNYTSWEINQISGNANSFPKLYTRNNNLTGANRSTTIKIDDTNNTYEQSTLTKVITQLPQPLTGIVNIPSSVDAAQVTLGGLPGTYVNNTASTTTTYFSVGIKTNYEETFTITKFGSGGIWISETFDGSAVSSITVNSSVPNAPAFYIRYSTGGSAEIYITGPDSNSSAQLDVTITPQSTGGGGGGGTPPVRPPQQI